MGKGEKSRGNEYSLSPTIRGSIAHMENMMHLPEYNHAGTPLETAIALWRERQISSFAHFEFGLREMGSRVFFIAMPRALLEGSADDIGKERTIWEYIPVKEGRIDVEGEVETDMRNYRITYPIGNKGEPNYWIYVAVNGAREAAQVRESLSVTKNVNLRRLRTAGVLSIAKE